MLLHSQEYDSNVTKNLTRASRSNTGTEYDDKIVADVTVEDDEEEEQENTALLKEQNEMLQRRLKRLEQQIAIMARSARRSYPREQTRQQQEFKTPSPSSLTRSPMMSSVYVILERIFIVTLTQHVRIQIRPR